MQEINLLQTKLKDRAESYDRRNSLITGFLGVVVVAMLAGSGFLYYLNASAKTDISTIKAETAAIQTKLDSSQGELASARAFQAQLKNIEKLVGGHLNWTDTFIDFEESILQRSQQAVITSRSTGKFHIEGIVDNYTDLGKILLSLSTKTMDGQDQPVFTNVKLLSVLTNQAEKVGFRYSIDFEIKPELLIKK